jgi:hypothetical protein
MKPPPHFLAFPYTPVTPPPPFPSSPKQVGFGRSSYMDSVNWAQLFCTPGLDPSKDCGPQLPPPPQLIHPKQGGRCLISNATTFPCVGGWNESCPITLGDCADPTASTWAWATMGGGGRTLTNTLPTYAGTVINVDCNACTPGTLTKVIDRGSYANALTWNSSGGGVLQVDLCPGMCLSGTTTIPRNTPCKAGEWYQAATQVVLVECSDPDAMGWTV